MKLKIILEDDACALLETDMNEQHTAFTKTNHETGHYQLIVDGVVVVYTTNKTIGFMTHTNKTHCTPIDTIVGTLASQI